ncbi:MAG: recombinase family protein [Oliverpabstia sp.]|nr:recombinase family protein [Oliverpabstia sp.]
MSKILKSYQVASYLRLSREDGDKTLSDSIANQRSMIADYVRQHEGLILTEEYIDDGYSGTNFDRPAFTKMMEDIKAKKINCVIVKDLSRLGRNYIETGRYLENIFPLYGVRFISILDRYDNVDETGDVDQIIVPFKNLINDAYCRDISMKIKSHFEVKRKSGQFIGSFASYGYAKDPHDKNHLVIDPYAGEVVKAVFRMKIEGMSSQHIAERLNELGVLPPSEYKRMSGLNFDCGFRCGEDPKWSAVSINRILTNEMYTGVMVQGINEKISYRFKQSRPVPKDEWIRVPGTHEPIISFDVFERVQNLIGLDTRTAPTQDAVYIFSGFVVCGDCGQNMVRRKVKKKDKHYVYYHCSTYKNGEGCSSHLFSDEKLKVLVLEAIRNQIALVMDAEEIVRQIDALPEENFAVKSLDTQIQVLLNEIERYKNLKTQLYTDKMDEVVSVDEYTELNHRFNKKIEAAQEKCDRLVEKRRSLLKKETHLQPWLEEFKQYREITELNRQIVVALIQNIVVFNKKEIQINFRYQDEMQELLMMAGIVTECIHSYDEIQVESGREAAV